MIYDCIIIGAGAAGLFCAASMEKKINGLILEKTPRTGTKLLMSGSGPTVFGLFENKTTARNAFYQLRRTNLAKQVYLTEIYNNRRQRV